LISSLDSHKNRMQGQNPMRKTIAAFFLAALTVAAAQAQSSAPAKSTVDAKTSLKFVVVYTRHGVRSPTGKTDALNRYSSQPWPQWSVPPGNLTAHGAQLMTIFGRYDRELFASQGLLAATGCGDAAHIRVIADSDQRTRETGKALAEGLAPGCGVAVTALPEGTPDPLFHPLSAGVGAPDKAQAAAAIAGRIGNNPQGVTDAYRAQLNALEDVLRGDGKSAAEPQSLFSVPASITTGKGDHAADFSSPLSLASSMTENLLLEYAEGMDNVGWGRVDLAKLRELLQLHVASEDIAQRTPYIARAQSSNILDHMLRSMRQAVNSRPVAGALSKPDDRLLILVGHDNNQANLAGSLGINWLIDGRRDDTPPGGALIFELWQNAQTGEYSVRSYYTAQTLDQMRNSTSLSLAAPPERVPVFLPACGRADGSCSWSGFEQALTSAIEPEFVK
jgi:4-phytase/acid phosphatase